MDRFALRALGIVGVASQINVVELGACDSRLVYRVILYQ